MLSKKTGWFWKSSLIAIGFLQMVSASGCGTKQADKTISKAQERIEDRQEKKEKVTEICINLYKEATEEKRTGDLEMIRSIVSLFGENGYPAVDSRNQINMTESSAGSRVLRKGR